MARNTDRPAIGFSSRSASPSALKMSAGTLNTVKSAVLPIVFQKKVNCGLPGVTSRR